MIDYDATNFMEYLDDDPRDDDVIFALVIYRSSCMLMYRLLLMNAKVFVWFTGYQPALERASGTGE